MATIYEVSALAGVSLSSVSRVMNNHEHVSEKTKIKVKAAMETLGYRPNAVARSLASNRSDCVGILVSQLHGPFFGDILTGIEQELRAAGKHSIIAAGHSDKEIEQDSIDFLIGRNCDALILLVDAVSDEYLLKLSQGKTPFVIINRRVTELEDRCFYLDNHLGGYLATKHLIEQGHRDIAYISGPLTIEDATARLQGHKKALSEYGISFNPALSYEGDYLTQSGQDGASHLINQNQSFSAIVCANDEMAAGAMRSIRDNNIEIPRDCSVVGFDNVFFAEYLYPKLSTIDYPRVAMAKMSAQWVLKNVYKKKNITISNVFTPTLVARQSIQAL